MTLTTLEDYVKREIFKSDKELFDFCPACDETGNTIRALMEGLFTFFVRPFECFRALLSTIDDFLALLSTTEHYWAPLSTIEYY